MAPLLIRKPRFVLDSTLALNPDIPHDSDPVAYWREQEAVIEAKVRAEYEAKYRNGYSIENAADPVELENVLRETGVYPSSSEYLNDVMVKVYARKMGKAVEEDVQADVADSNCSKMLTQINQALDEYEAVRGDHGIRRCPTSANPLLRTKDVILLTPTRKSSRAAESPAETHFAIHKTLLVAESLAFFAHARKHSKLKVFNVDADADTLGRMIKWFYDGDYDLKRLLSNQLLSLLCVALDICIPALHNDIIEALMHQHWSHFAAYMPRRLFAPNKEEVRRVYEKSNKGDGARMCISYLLALSGGVEVAYSEVAGWERTVRLDAWQWEAKENMLRRWEKMPAESFFMSASRKRHRHGVQADEDQRLKIEF